MGLADDHYFDFLRLHQIITPLKNSDSFYPLNPLKSIIAGFDRPIQIFLSMGQRDKTGFELGRRKIDPLLHHFDKELCKSLCIAHLRRGIIPDWPFCEKESEHSIGPID